MDLLFGALLVGLRVLGTLVAALLLGSRLAGRRVAGLRVVRRVLPSRVVRRQAGRTLVLRSHLPLRLLGRGRLLRALGRLLLTAVLAVARVMVRLTTWLTLVVLQGRIRLRAVLRAVPVVRAIPATAAIPGIRMAGIPATASRRLGLRVFGPGITKRSASPLLLMLRLCRHARSFERAYGNLNACEF